MSPLWLNDNADFIVNPDSVTADSIIFTASAPSHTWLFKVSLKRRLSA